MRVEQKTEPASTAGKEKKPEKFVPPQPVGKIVVIVILVIASTALFWLAWHNALTTGLEFNLSTQNVLVVVSTLLAFCLMFSLLAVAEIVITKNLVEFGMTIIAAATIFIFFKPALWSFIAFLLTVLAFLYWRREIRIDEKSRAKFMPSRIINSGLKLTVTLILLAACLNYYNFTVTKPDAEKDIADGLIEKGAKAVQNVLTMYYGDRYDPHMSIDDFINNIGLGSSDKEDVGVETGQPEIDDVINEGLLSVQEGLVDEGRDNFLETFGITAMGDEEMQVIVEKIVRKNVQQYVDPYLKFVPALIAVSLFFILNILSFIYRELIKSFSYLLFHILVWIRFLKMSKIQIEAEKISLNDGKG